MTSGLIEVNLFGLTHSVLKVNLETFSNLLALIYLSIYFLLIFARIFLALKSVQSINNTVV